MSEIKIFYKDKEKIKVARTISALKELDKKDIIWIDLLDVSDKTEDTLEVILRWVPLDRNAACVLCACMFSTPFLGAGLRREMAGAKT